MGGLVDSTCLRSILHRRVSRQSQSRQVTSTGGLVHGPVGLPADATHPASGPDGGPTRPNVDWNRDQFDRRRHRAASAIRASPHLSTHVESRWFFKPVPRGCRLPISRAANVGLTRPAAQQRARRGERCGGPFREDADIAGSFSGRSGSGKPGPATPTLRQAERPPARSSGSNRSSASMRSASAGGLSHLSRATRGKRIAMPDLWRLERFRPSKAISSTRP